jgi:hypothetical protein
VALAASFACIRLPLFGGRTVATQKASEWRQQWAQVVARAWADPAFKRRLLADPAAALKDQGLAVPAGLQVRVLEDTSQVLHLTLPPKPDEELAEDELQMVAAGVLRTALGH